MWLDEVKFNDAGLVPVIAQSKANGRVLMLAWANREALEETVRTGRGVYFSRSRSRLWRKGEESGNVQRITAVRLDCDGDAVLYEVEQVGGTACHTGHESCFYRTLVDGAWRETESLVKDPAVMYRHDETATSSDR